MSPRLPVANEADRRDRRRRWIAIGVLGAATLGVSTAVSILVGFFDPWLFFGLLTPLIGIAFVSLGLHLARSGWVAMVRRERDAAWGLTATDSGVADEGESARERILAVAYSFSLDRVTRTTGELVFTSRRLLFAPFGAAGPHWGGEQVDLGEQRRPVEVDLEALASVCEPGLVHTYAELAAVRLKPHRLRYSRVVVEPKVGKRRKYWGTRENLVGVLDRAEDLAESGVPLRSR